MLEPFLIIGAGGHAKVIIDALLCLYGTDFRLQVADDNVRRAGDLLLGFPIVVPIADAVASSKSLRPGGDFHVAIGDNKIRADIANLCLSAGMNYASIVHPQAMMAFSALIGAGTFVAAGAILGPESSLGMGTIVNHGAVVDHDCRVGAYCHLAQNATLGGGVTIGEGVLIGPGAALASGVTIGSLCVIGAGAKVLSDLPPGSLYS